MSGFDYDALIVGSGYGGSVSVERRHDGKVEVTVGSEIGFFDVRAHKDTKIEAVVGIRQLLEAAGFSESGPPD